MIVPLISLMKIWICDWRAQNIAQEILAGHALLNIDTSYDPFEILSWAVVLFFLNAFSVLQSLTLNY